MTKFGNLLPVSVLALALIWALTAPGWFASGAVGRAMTDLDIWAQIHLPYPVLTLLLAGFAVTFATLWLRRHMPPAHKR